MVGTAFDRFARALAHTAGRRPVLGLLAASVPSNGPRWISVRAAADDVAIEACRPDGRRCHRGRNRRKSCGRCCSNRGTRKNYVIIDHRGKRRCSCRPDGKKGCVNDSQCCSGICEQRVCRRGDDAQCAGATCASFEPCGSGGSCVCASTASGGGLCVDGAVSCEALRRCPNGQSDCPGSTTCVVNSCCVDPVCITAADQCGAGRTSRPAAPERAGRGQTLGGR